MFKSDSEENEELGFADAYKYDILKNREPKKDTSYKGLIIIISLVAFVLGGAIFGFIYMGSSSNVEEIEPPEESVLLNNIDEIDEEEEQKEENNDSTLNDENPNQDNYIEDLAKLSKGIDEGR